MSDYDYDHDKLVENMKRENREMILKAAKNWSDENYHKKFKIFVFRIIFGLVGCLLTVLFYPIFLLFIVFVAFVLFNSINLLDLYWTKKDVLFYKKTGRIK